jgi:hypothetical protein
MPLFLPPPTGMVTGMANPPGLRSAPVLLMTVGEDDYSAGGQQVHGQQKAPPTQEVGGALSEPVWGLVRASHHEADCCC